MSVANLQQNIPNRQFTIYNLPMPYYDADKFSDWLTDNFKLSAYKSFSALADQAKLSRSTVSALAGSKKQSLTDKPSQPKLETVIALARALEVDVNENLYEVSNIGRVRSLRRNIILKPFPRSHYLAVQLANKGTSKRVSVHRLVAAAFIGECPPNLVVNHIDANKLNNAAINLEYLTTRQNHRHAVLLGLYSNYYQKRSDPLTESDILVIHALGRFNLSQRLIAETFLISSTTVGDILRGKSWKNIKPVRQPKLKKIAENVYQFKIRGRVISVHY